MNGRTNGVTSAAGCARGLGWFSIGLGAMELFFPRKVGRMIGLPGHAKLTCWMGVREIGAGIGVLSELNPVGSMAGRVAGDALDLSLLVAGMASRGSSKAKVGAALGMVAGVTALDVCCLLKLGRSAGPIQTTQVVSINKSPEECYRFWRNFENLPKFLEHVQSVQMAGDRRSHWVVKAPAGVTVEWDAELLRDEPERIEWRSLPGADVENTGTIEFRKAPAGHGTIVRASIQYKPPAGQVGFAIAKLFAREPGMQAKSDLKRFKALIETGEVPTIIGQSSGRVLSRT